MANNLVELNDLARKKFPSRGSAQTGHCETANEARRHSPTRHLSVNQYVRLLAVIENVGGIATLDEISRALPSVKQPISAVFDLCDFEILCADWESAFDGDMRIWRIDR